MHRFLLLTLLAAASAAPLAADPPHHVYTSERANMMVFPADSLDLSIMTFTVDGDTVSRQEFIDLDPCNIRRLTVIPAPANLIEVETRTAAMKPLSPEDLPSDILYIIDGLVADREAFTALPSEVIRAIAVVKGPRPALVVTTKTAPRHHR